jgi:prevent-host-death family protein
MRTMSVSEFRANCLAVIDEMSLGGEPVTITRRGVPVARLQPLSREESGSDLGRLRGRFRDLGDIVSPVVDSQDWHAEQR